MDLNIHNCYAIAEHISEKGITINNSELRKLIDLRNFSSYVKQFLTKLYPDDISKHKQLWNNFKDMSKDDKKSFVSTLLNYIKEKENKVVCKTDESKEQLKKELENIKKELAECKNRYSQLKTKFETSSKNEYKIEFEHKEAILKKDHIIHEKDLEIKILLNDLKNVARQRDEFQNQITRLIEERRFAQERARQRYNQYKKF